MEGEMTYDETIKVAEKLNNSADQMDKEFENLKKEMDALETVLKSKGADELYNTYKTLEAKIHNYTAKVREFSSFLNAAVEEYQGDDVALIKDVNA